MDLVAQERTKVDSRLLFRRQSLQAAGSGGMNLEKLRNESTSQVLLLLIRENRKVKHHAPHYIDEVWLASMP